MAAIGSHLVFVNPPFIDPSDPLRHISLGAAIQQGKRDRINTHEESIVSECVKGTVDKLFPT